MENSTTIRICEGNKVALERTSSPKNKAHLEGLAKGHPDEVRLVQVHEDGSVEYEVPADWIFIAPPEAKSDSLEKAGEQHE